MLLRRRLCAEALGTAFLLIAVVGSGIAAQRLSPNDIGLQLFENAAATGAALVAIILMMAPVSGAHLNPVVTLAARLEGDIETRPALGYVGAQVVGAIAGVMIANLMFDLPALEWSTKERFGGNLLLAEVVATFGLVFLVLALARTGRTAFVPFAVGAYISGAYFYTASTSFANPAVTIGRGLTNTFTGIDPASVPAFIVFQIVGALLAVGVARVLYPMVATDKATT